MINNDMYSLCIDINNKLFPGKLHFASCQVCNLQRFHMNPAENLTTHLHRKMI